MLKTPLEDFKTVIQTRLNSPASPEARRSVDNGSKQVYIVSDRRDHDAVQTLKRLLFSQGFDVVLSLFEGDEASIRRDHEENLRECDGALIYYGAGSELWFRSKWRDLKKSAGYGRAKPPLAKAVVLAPPLTADKSDYGSHEAVVINWADEPTADLFAPFLTQLG